MARLIMERSLSVPKLAQVDHTSVCVEWDAVPLTHEEDGADIWMDVSLSFQLEMQQVKEDELVSEEGWCIQYCGPATHVQVKGLHPGRKYAMRVQQFPAVADPRVLIDVAPASDALIFQTKATCPSAMMPPILVGRNHHSLALKWSDPEENGGHPISQYVLEGTLPPRMEETSHIRLNSQGMFEIYRGSEKSFMWDGLSPGCRYNVRVKAVNCLGDGAYSSIASFLTQPTVPDAPSQVMCTATTRDMLTIEWSQPRHHGAESILYSVEIDDGSGYRRVAKVHVCTLVLAKLSSDTEYKIRVCAENSEGCSPWSPVASCRTTPEISKPHTPKNLVHRRDGNASVFSWDPHAPTEGERYVLEVAEMSNQEKDQSRRQLWKVRYKSDEPEYTIMTLKGEFKYLCSVKSVNEAGASSYSSPIIVDMTEISHNVKPPDAPRDFGYDSECSTFFWDLEKRSTKETYIFELQMSRSSDLLGSQRIKNPWKLIHRGEESRYPMVDADDGTKYIARVRSLYGGRTSEWTGPIDFVYESRACPGVLTNVRASVDSSLGRIYVEWDPLVEQAYSGRWVEYIVEKKVSEESEEYRQVYQGCHCHWTFEGVGCDTTYYFRVRGVNKHGHGPWSAPVFAMIKPAPPHAPDKIQVSFKDSRSICVTWNLPRQTPNSPLNGIQIEEARMEHFCKVGPVIHALDVCESHTLTTLQASTMYVFRVRAKNAHGCGPWSSSISAETDPDVPASPETPSILPCGPGNVFKAIWQYPDDNGGVVTDFDLALSRTKCFEKYKIVYHGPDLSYKIQDLDFCSEYFIRVRANNSSGSGHWSRVQKIMTLQPPPQPPKSISVRIDREISVTWSKSPPPEESLCVGYEVEVSRCRRSGSLDGKHHRSDKKFTIVFKRNFNARTTSCSIPLPDGAHGSEIYARIRSVGNHGVGHGPWSKHVSCSGSQSMRQLSGDYSSMSSDQAVFDAPVSPRRGTGDQVASGYSLNKHRAASFRESKVARKPKKHKSGLSRIWIRLQTYSEGGLGITLFLLVLLMFSLTVCKWFV